MTAIPVVLGLDGQTSRLGYGAVRLDDGSPVTCGCVEIRRENRDDWRVGFDRAVRVAMTDIAIALWARVAPKQIPPPTREIAAVYVEKPGGGRSVQGTLDIAWVSGQVAQAAGRRWQVDVWCLRPAEWKRLAGLGGNASKEEVQRRTIDLFADAGQQAPLAVIVPPWGTQDACDALCIARAGWQELQRAAEAAA